MKEYRERKPDKMFHYGAKKEWEGIVKVVCTHTYLVPYVVSGKDKDEAMKNTKKRMSDRGRRPRGVQTEYLKNKRMSVIIRTADKVQLSVTGVKHISPDKVSKSKHGYKTFKDPKRKKYKTKYFGEESK